MTTFTHQLLSRKTSMPEVWQCDCEYSSRSATCPSGVPRRQPHRRSGLATLPSVGAVP